MDFQMGPFSDFWSFDTLCDTDYYRTEPSIVPCSTIIPPPNFQKKSEILKISHNNPTPKFQVTPCQIETSIW